MRILYLLFFPLLLFGFPTGNPLSPAMLQRSLFGRSNGLLSIGVGYLADFMTDLPLQVEGKPEVVNFEAPKNFSMESQMSALSIHLVRRLEIYGYLGTSAETLDYRPFIGGKMGLKSGTNFSYTVGGKAILLDFHRAVLSLDYSYFCIPSSSTLRKKLQGINLPDFITTPLGSQKMQWRQWHLAMGTALRLGPLSPYVGGRYSHAKLKILVSDSPSIRLKGEKHWGLFAGLSLMLSHSFFVTGELRWFDETAYSTSAVLAF